MAYSKKPDTRDGLQPVCKPCASAFRKKWLESKPGYTKAYNDYYAAQNRDFILAQRKVAYAERQDEMVEIARAYRKLNTTAVRARARAYYSKNREQCLATTRKWREQFGKQWGAADRLEKPAKYRAKNSKRRAALLQAVPAWANLDKIQEFYDTAEALGMWTGEWYHVDHIVPLLGKTVRGLHCEANLQIMTSAENRTKGNRHWPNQP
jgi:hypothetical protein